MRVCQIGCGGHARHVYRDSLLVCRKADPSLVLAACCDTDAESAWSYARETGFQQAFTDYHTMLEAAAPDAVLLVTPYQVTDVLAADLLRRGVPTLIEKPPAETLAKMLALIEIAQQTGTIHQVAYNRRHMPMVRELIGHVAGRTIQHIDFEMYRVNRRDPAFFSTAVHGFDLVRHLAGGELLEMHAVYRPLENPGSVNAVFLCTFAGGITAALTFCPMSGLVSEQVTVIAVNDTVLVDLPIWGERVHGGLLEHYHENRLIVRMTDADFPDGTSMVESNGFVSQLRVFLKRVDQGMIPEDSLASGLDASILGECMRLGKTDYRRGEL
ncbi:hypothetical protein AGMMS49992_20420 [Clostridia bacterium]|nr:hypothetical protein AGMMS49992_20420 [Clostridia bacterium]